MKKMLLYIFLAVILCLMVACSGDSNNATIRIVIVTSSSEVHDGSFNENNWDGIQKFITSQDNNNISVHTIRDHTGTAVRALGYVEAVASEFDIIVLPGFQFAGVAHIAINHPKTHFILVDAWPETLDGDIVSLPNVLALRFAEQESGFLAGVVAAMETETGLIAFVGGMPIPPVVNYHLGFNAGVDFANTTLGTDAQIVNLHAFAGEDIHRNNIAGNYANSFTDIVAGTIIGNALIAENVDIIFIAAGSTGTGVFNAIKQHDGNVMAIGVDVDQFSHGQIIGGRNIVLTSALKVMDLNVYRGLTAFANNTFEGGNHIMCAASNSTGIVTADGRHQMSPETLAQVNELFSKIADGIISVGLL